MNQSKSRIVTLIVVSLLAFAGLYLAGRWLQGLYGLDPPNAYFWLGSLLQLASFLAPAVAIVWLLIAYWRAKRNA